MRLPEEMRPAIIGNHNYSGHALDRMQDRGLMPSVIENTIQNGIATTSRGGTTVYFDSKNNLSSIVNKYEKLLL
ncbi:hypothetical protein GCM10011289_05300 [Paludibacterium paludis]|uniref:Uncharacterized protein n=1 Tax=Paludibacterium paludis TaxID=1225769 RepID=A0A918NXW5_9NEIS|nr:hypothetical protein GCM10011289_05300 [Paludibacterium paludis]